MKYDMELDITEYGMEIRYGDTPEKFNKIVDDAVIWVDAHPGEEFTMCVGANSYKSTRKLLYARLKETTNQKYKDRIKIVAEETV